MRWPGYVIQPTLVVELANLSDIFYLKATYSLILIKYYNIVTHTIKKPQTLCVQPLRDWAGPFVPKQRSGRGVISRFKWSLVPRDRTLSVARPLPIHAYLHARSARNFIYGRSIVNSLNCRNMAFYCILGMPVGISFAARALIRLRVSKGLWISLCTP